MSTYKKVKVGIIDYKLNNLFSIYNALKEIGYKTSIIDIKNKNYNSYDLVVLPGVGSYDAAMKYIKYYSINDKINSFISKKNKIFFGICLGMQLLFESSNEFKKTNGLSIIPGHVKSMKNDKNHPIPHIGWNNLKILNNKNQILQNRINYYFVHSFYCDPKNKKHILSETKYGKNKFCSSIFTDNIIATQFHPEKSGLNGIKLLKNIIKVL
jgi:glutamine amidotransferase